jgi:hypothetical protein
VLGRWATQMSSKPTPPGRFDAMYMLSPSGDWTGQPSRNGVFNSASFPPVSSSFWAGAHPEKCIAWAVAVVVRLTIATANASVVHLRMSRSLHGVRLHAPSRTVTVGRVTARVTGGSTWA